MKKAPFLLITLIILIGGLSVLAQGTSTVSSGITPDSPFYFFKTWKENIQLFFTFGQENKAKQFLHLADVRLAEYQKMIEKGKTEIAQKVLDKYEKQFNNATQKIEELKKKGKNVMSLEQQLEEKKNNKETAGWKTYTNNNVGFEIKYPSLWESPFKDWAGGWTAGKFLDDNNFCVVGISSSLSLEPNQYPEIADLLKKGYIQTSIKIGGIDGIRLTDHSPNTGLVDAVYFFYKGNNFRIDRNGEGAKIEKECSEIFNQMLSTFKITGTSTDETTDWKEYLLEENTKDFNSPDFTDRRLVGIKDSGQRDIIVASVKELMGWQKDFTRYPRKVSFPAYSQEIFFTKGLSETAHSGGFYMLNVKTLVFEELTEIGKIYENYYNYQSIISPDGFKIAALGAEDLYLLDLLKNEAKILAKASSEEIFNPAGKLPDFIWLDNYTIQYPVYSVPLSSATQKPIEIRKISINKNETADWKTYKSDKWDFEIKYPSNYKISKDIQTDVGPALTSDSYAQIIFRNFTYTRSQIDLEKSKSEKVTISSLDGYRYPATGNMDGGIDISVSFYDYPNTNNVFNILFSTTKSGEEDEVSVFNKILSTLRFDLKSDTSIKTGEVKIDYQALQTLQDSVNQGHQPWRLDSESVVRAEILQHGFVQSDLSSLKLTSQAASAAIDNYEIVHNGKVYVIRAIQVVPGEGQVWTISSIKLK